MIAFERHNNSLIARRMKLCMLIGSDDREKDMINCMELNFATIYAILAEPHDGLRQNKIMSPCHLKKRRHYSKEYLPIDLKCTDSEDNHVSVCYDILSNKTMKPSKLRRHLDTNNT